MPIWMAFLALTVIWGSTPLAIQWSQAGGGYQFAVTARMAIGALVFLFLVPWMKRRPFPPGQGVVVALVAGTSLFASIFCVYWGARYVPSGWISVLYGLGPVLTGILAAIWLHEPFTKAKMVGSLLGLAGLMFFFVSGEQVGDHAPIGVGVIILSVLLYAMGNIAIKRWSRDVAPVWVAAGALWVAFPLFLITFFLSGESWPAIIPLKSGLAILYLGVVANVVGFVIFYYLLSRISAANATLVTLTAPSVALWLGVAFNQERLHGGLVLGTLLILGGLSLFQWGFTWPHPGGRRD